jgi:hypothetical protein
LQARNTSSLEWSFCFSFAFALEFAQIPHQMREAASSRESRKHNLFLVSGEKAQQEGGGRLYRLSSRRTVGMGSPAGAIRGYEVGASKTDVRTTGGIQLVEVLVRRCRLCSGDECLCAVGEE